MADTLNSIMQGTAKLESLADVDEVVKNLSRLLKNTVKSRWTAVYFFDREQRNFTPAHSFGLPASYRPLFQEMPLVSDKIPLLKKMLRRKQHLQITDCAHSELLSPRFRRLLKSLTLLAVPMVVRTQVMGAVFVTRHLRHPPFSEQEIAMIRDMVSHAALVVSHMRLFDESLEMALDLAGRTDVILTLDEINKAISSSLSRDQILETAMEHIERIATCELVAILNRQGDDLVMTAARSGSVRLPALLQHGSRVQGKSLAMSAFARRESRYIGDLAKQKRLPPLDRSLARAGIRTLLAIPLVSKEMATGVLLLGDSRGGQFGREASFAIEKIAAQVAVALENARLYEEMRTLFISTVASLANAIDAKSPWTKGHSERVMHVAANIAKEMGLAEPVVERVRLGGLLHDIGKIGVIEALLEKPAMLSEDEFPPLRLHPEKGVAILAPIEQLRDVLPGILHHHERYDGSGYPKGLAGREIPLEARIIAVADAFDAMVADRPYKKGFSVQEALDELGKCAGRQFDRAVVECFSRYVARKMGIDHPAADPACALPAARKRK